MLVIELTEARATRVERVIERYSLVTGIDLTPEQGIPTPLPMIKRLQNASHHG